jgi:hypothetical protein
MARWRTLWLLTIALNACASEAPPSKQPGGAGAAGKGAAGTGATGTGAAGAGTGPAGAGPAGAGGQAPPQVDRVPTASSGELLALTYNVAGLPEILSGSMPSENTQYISPLLNGYDLVLVQEDWLTPDPNPLVLKVYHDVLASQAKQPYRSTPAPLPMGVPLPFALPGNSRPPAIMSDGLNEFSNFPFGALTRVKWTECFGGLDKNDHGDSDCLAEKGFMTATHTLATGVEVDVYTFHGEAGSSDEDQRLSGQDYLQLGAYIKEHSAGRAIILGGDTNLHVDSEPADLTIWRTFLTTAGLRDVCDTLACGQDAAQIDKFAYRAGDKLAIEPLTHHFEREKFVRPDGQPLSDHLALAVRFRWSRR